MPSPLRFACLSFGLMAVEVLSGVSSMLDTIETQSFEVFTGIMRKLLPELFHVKIRTAAVLTV